MDIAKLGVTVTNQGVDATIKSLNDLKVAAGGAEVATENVTKGSTRAAAGIKTEGEAAKTTSGAMRDYASNSNVAATAQGALAKQVMLAGNAHNIAAHNVGNMTQQLIDVGTTAAMGINPLMILIQQGGQIATVYAAAGVSLGAWATQYGVMLGILKRIPAANLEVAATNEAVALSAAQVNAANVAFVPTSQAAIAARLEMSAANVAVEETATAAAAAETVALTPLLPIILAVAAAAALMAGAFALFKADADKAADNDAFIKSLGLSKRELKELKDTSVTTGDVLKGFWRTIDQDGKVSKTFKNIADWGVGAFRVVLEAAEWFIAGSIAGLEAVAHAAKGIAMVLTGDFSGFDYFNHSFDNLIDNAKSAKAAMDQFWASTQKNIIAVNHERITAQANAIKEDRNPNGATATTNDRFKVRSGEDYEFSRGAITKAGETLGKPNWPEIQVPRSVIASVEDLARANIHLTDTYADLRKAGGETAKTIGDAFYDAATGADKFFHSLLSGLQRMVAAWAANDIEHIFNKLFHVDDSATYQASPIGGIADAIGSWFGGAKANAMGGVYSSPSLSAYSNGVYDSPQTFAFAKGAGIFAEAGPEAIMPLSRGPDGRLGVQMNGGGQNGGADFQAAVLEAVKAITGHINNISATQAGKATYKFSRALPQRFDQMQRQGT